MSLRPFKNYDLPGMPPVLAWNPFAMRCTPVDEGCARCWACGMAARLEKNPTIHPYNRESYAGGVPTRADSYMKCQRWPFPKNPHVIAIQFMGDLWHPSCDVLRPWVINDIISDGRNDKHVFLLLTKRPERVTETLPDNCWLGTSVHDQTSADSRIPQLLKVKCKHRWISAEPLLGNIEFCCNCNNRSFDLGYPRAIEFIACGPETGAGSRPCDPLWIASISEYCNLNLTAFYDKRDPSTQGFTRREWPQEWIDKIGGKK